MDKTSTSCQLQKSSTGRRVRLIPTTPRPAGTAVPTSRPTETPNVSTSQPPETSTCNLYARIIREAMAKLNNDEVKEGKTNSLESSSEAATLSGTKTACPTSSSSLRFSTDDEDEADEGQGRRKTGRTFEEIASEVIREMKEIEEKKKGEAMEAQELGDPQQAPAGMVNVEPQESPVREI